MTVAIFMMSALVLHVVCTLNALVTSERIYLPQFGIREDAIALTSSSRDFTKSHTYCI